MDLSGAQKHDEELPLADVVAEGGQTVLPRQKTRERAMDRGGQTTSRESFGGEKSGRKSGGSPLVKLQPSERIADVVI